MRILSFGNNPKLGKDNIFVSLWESFQSLNFFIRVYVLTAILIVVSTPFIVSSTQTFRQHAQVTYNAQTVNSGNWSNPSVWNTGSIPKAGDNVKIKQGHTITYDVVKDDILGEVSVEGTLKFSRTQSTRLKTDDNIMVEMGGLLDMGIATDYIPKNVKAEVIFVLTQAQADAYVGGFDFQPTDKGLWAMDGSRWEVNGAPLLHAWSKITQDAASGSSFVIVDNNVSDWYVGGTVIVTMTNQPAKYFIRSDGQEVSTFTYQNELRVITSLESLSDGKTKITLDNPLSFAHSGTAPMRGEVGLLTRNVVIRTERPDLTQQDMESVGTRDKRKFAHTMYMHGSKGNVQFAEFKYMGHYGKKARYPIHPHNMLETSQGMILRGNGLWYTGFRWIDTHNSQGILVEDNVGFSSVSSGYFVERDDVFSSNKDVAFVHNLGVETMGKTFADRGTGPGEYHRVTAFWPDSVKTGPSGNPEGASALGNVAVATRDGQDTSGYHFPEGSGPFLTFVKNEAHGIERHGIFTWQNNIRATDIVDSLLWRNGNSGLSLGAYTGDYNFYRAQLLENGKVGLTHSITQAFLQDSVVTGSKESNSRKNEGYHIGAYIALQHPVHPVRLIRNTFKNLDIGFTQNHDPCVPTDEKEVAVSGSCGGAYVHFFGNKFENVQKQLDFGWQPNANSWWYVKDAQGLDADLPSSFMVLRKDALDPAANGGVLPPFFKNAASFRAAEIDAVVTPLVSLADSISPSFTWVNRLGTTVTNTFTMEKNANFPPVIDVNVSANGTTATLTANVSDDRNSITRVEFFLDEKLIATKIALPYQINVDLSKTGRKYAYLYARAFDGSTIPVGDTTLGILSRQEENRSYSNVIEIGPEVLVSGQPLPTPTPTGAITPTPTRTPTPTVNPTNTPTPSVILSPTPTPTRTPTPVPTSGPTPTKIPTSTPKPTSTPTPTSIISPTSAPTPTPTPAPIACAITSASWISNANPAAEGSLVSLSVITNNSPLCSGKQVAFEVRENDSLLEGVFDDFANVQPANAPIFGSTATTTWIAEYVPDGLFGIFDPPEYYFKANIAGNGSLVRSSDPLLSVNRAPIPAPIPTPTQAPGSAIVMEAEGMSLTGYKLDPDNSSWIKLPGISSGTATKSFPGADGTYKIKINAVKESDGQSTLELWINGVLRSTFTYPLGTIIVEPFVIDGPTVDINLGNQIKLVGKRDGGAWARVDSISFTSVSGNTPTRTPTPTPTPIPTSGHTPTPTPRLACAAYKEQSGVVTIEAENYHVIKSAANSNWVLRSDISGASNSKFMRARPDIGTNHNTGYAANSPMLGYKVRFTNSGTYRVWVRGYSTDGANNSVHVGLDGKEISTSDKINSFDRNNWTWHKDTMDGVIATMNITSGEHVINVWMREDGFRFDKIILTKNSTFVPTVTGPRQSQCISS